MSESIRRAQPFGILCVEALDWHFRVYLLMGDSKERIDQNVLFRNLTEKVRIVAADYLSEEFKYLRSGFILAHYGRRGVTYSLWHWADWEGTWEFFCQAWYCYGRAVESMGPLDRREPILCQHEIDIVTLEGIAFRNLASRYADHGKLTLEYRNLKMKCI